MRRLVVATVLFATWAPAVASAACPRTSLAAIENSVMCQVCGVPLGLATESPEAARERALITRLVDRCESAAQVKAGLVAQYGPSVLALPPQKGFDLAAWLVPGLGLACAATLLTMVAVAWRGRQRAAGARLPPRLNRDDAARVEAALERFER
jgi:cytochrome c-type biogenesis protein CcmH